jgi:diguanylate cyclase (GGDEF)-like protein/putative nucleotidyltransferase with HDIG domain
MTHLPFGLRVYIGVVLALGGGLLALALGSIHFDEPARFLLFLILSSLASILKISIPMPRLLSQNGLTMSLSFMMNFAAMLVLGVHEAAIIGAVGAFCQCTFNVRHKNPLYRTLFSMGALAITLELTGFVYLWAGGTLGSQSTLVWSEEVLPLALAACTHFLINTGLVAGAIALSAEQPLVVVWAEHFLSGWINQMLGATMGVLIAGGLHQTRYWLLPITTLLLYLTFRTYRTYNLRIETEQRAAQQMSDLHESTLEALALAIDAKDRHSRTHLRRVQTFSVALARAERLPEDEVQAVRTAALLHDIGKLAVPQHILSKTGQLSDEERRKLRIHPQVGAEIVRDVPFPSPVAPLILWHHERWDGTGYPSGLKQESIPLGARILAIADCADSFIGERAEVEDMHSRLSDVAAALREEAGKSLDPRLVSRFIELLPRLQIAETRFVADEAPAAPPLHADKTLQAQVDWAVRTVTSLASSPFEHIELAHREIHTLYELAQVLSACLSVNDTMVQLVSKLGALVPFSTCALFLHDSDRREISCRFASGPGALRLDGLRMAVGDSPIGWVVQQERSLVNISLTATMNGIRATNDVVPSSATHPSNGAGAAGASNVLSASGDAEGSFETDALRAALVCPLVVEGGCLGVLMVAQEKAAFYEDEHRRLLEQVAEHLSAAVQNSLRFERTREAALTDKLTGLTNSRGLAATFESAISQAKDQHESMAVLMIDVDEFKAINDTFGHAAGDRALREVARTLSSSIRSRDICARYAGDEFVIVLMRCGAPEADRRARELQAMFEGVRFAPEPGRLSSLHISVGSAAYPGDGSSLESLLVVADRRMYRDKDQRKRALAGRRSASASASASISI